MRTNAGYRRNPTVGRPSKEGEPKRVNGSAYVAVRLTPEVKRALDALAERRRTTVSALLRASILSLVGAEREPVA